jgi:hypothetical protein
MICPSCLRDVVHLIGRDGLCPDCFTLAKEDVIPEVVGGLVEAEEESWGLSFPDCSELYLPELAWGCVGDEAFEWSPEFDPFSDDDNRPGDLAPRFRGLPRF